jgi:purine-nucleoside phosphorylase
MMTEQLTETRDFLAKYVSQKPDVGIVLGTGLGKLASQIEAEHTISYADIPNFPVSTVESHDGKLIIGQLGSKYVIAMQGRFHYYEGYSMQQITLPIRVMKMLGVEKLFISNVSGAVNLQYHTGDLVIIDDHINLQTANPLTGPNLSQFGTRFPDMHEPYDSNMIHAAWKIAKEEGYRIHKGVYVAVIGPNLETRAEYRFIHRIGGDMVGMSTVPEVIVAQHMGLKVFAVSIITDLCNPDDLQPVRIEDILRIAGEAEPKLTRLMYRLINEY